MADRRFEDLKPGDSFKSVGVTVTEEEILEFATRYDPQPFRIDADAAKVGPFGGLIASGIHTLAISIRLMMQSGAFDLGDSLGSPGIEELRWPAPVRPGDTIHVVGTIIDMRPSKSKPGVGIVRYNLDAFNQTGDVVMTMMSAAFMRI